MTDMEMRNFGITDVEYLDETVDISDLVVWNVECVEENAQLTR